MRDRDPARVGGILDGISSDRKVRLSTGFQGDPSRINRSEKIHESLCLPKVEIPKNAGVETSCDHECFAFVRTRF